MKKDINQIRDENSRIEYAGNVGGAIGTGCALIIWVVIPLLLVVIFLISAR